MIQSTRGVRDFAKLVIVHEVKKERTESNGPAFGRVIEKLRQPLSTVVGNAGFRSLLSRALALAGAEVRWLRAVHVKADGALEYPAEIAQIDEKEVAEGELIL